MADKRPTDALETGIERQISLSWKQAFTISMRNATLRLGRAAVTGAGIVLGIAFLISVGTGRVIEQGVREHETKRDRHVSAEEDISATAVEDEQRSAAKSNWLIVMSLLVCGVGITNSLLMSVTERFREIGIYSSVGLAPVHIAFLFLAESCVYAVLGAVCGYLFAQAVAKILIWQELLQGFTLNYSSLSAISSAGLVMLVVIISTIYPARRASQMAVPDVTRRWKIPDPDGDRWHFEFPFTIAGREVLGLFTFLTRFFDFHTEGSMGTFYTEGAVLSVVPTDQGEGYAIDTTIWLAPFDLGVSQTVRLRSHPSGDHDIQALDIAIDRLSGDVSSWKRCNQRFMNQIRKQFLIWRTIQPEAQAQYRDDGLELIRTSGAPEPKPSAPGR